MRCTATIGNWRCKRKATGYGDKCDIHKPNRLYRVKMSWDEVGPPKYLCGSELTSDIRRATLYDYDTAYFLVDRGDKRVYRDLGIVWTKEQVT